MPLPITLPITRRRTAAVGGLLATAVLIGAFAVSAPAASAGDGPTAPPATSSGGAVDLAGEPVESRSYVGDEPPADLGTLECAAAVEADGTVTVLQGDCGDLRPDAG